MSGRPLRAVVVADDLTGAADAGVQFRRAGPAASVWLGDHPPARLGATVYDTDSRAMSPGAAAAALERLGAVLLEAGIDLIYKKVDSTMRGNVGAEVAALLRALGRRLAVLAPAFPANGRTTLSGAQLVNGVPAHLTSVGVDPAHPMRWPTIRAAIEAQSDLAVVLVPIEQVRNGVASLADALRSLPDAGEGAMVAVVDAENDGDLAAIAAAVAELGSACLPVGSAGLAAHLARAWALDVPRAPSLPAGEDRVRASLFVCGSLNPRTLEQVARLDCPSVRGGSSNAVDDVVAGMADRGIAVLSSVGWPGGPTAEAVAASLGRVVAAVTERTRPDALLLTGGDTARAVLGALEGHGIDLDEEILPGMPAGRIAGGHLSGVRVITKAGGFGPPNALVRARDYLRGGAAPNEETTP